MIMENKPNHFYEVIRSIFSPVFRKFSKLIDRILFNNKGMIIVSLLLSIMICITIDYDSIRVKLFNDLTTSVTISDVQVNVKADEDNYEISGVPGTVSVSLTGNSTDIQVFRQQKGVIVTCDLSKCKQGKNLVNLTVDSLPSNISAKVSPETIEVNLNPKVTATFSLSCELLVGTGQKVTDFETPVLSKKQVTIKASQETLESIRVVKALVDATGQYDDFVTKAKLVAYDINGNVINVDFGDEEIEASVTLAKEE
ncbi:hypothetical protein FYJ50_03795 [Erysipelotrichaceae bacterium LKV-178-WT-2G]|uniref:YbbR-like protein n=2 Tax=Floccifex porci TaxID=2606629 RepID=A0A7X2T3Q1_9FIRM|nr:hypothetical protein [Floccifex porci]